MFNLYLSLVWSRPCIAAGYLPCMEACFYRWFMMIAEPNPLFAQETPTLRSMRDMDQWDVGAVACVCPTPPCCAWRHCFSFLRLTAKILQQGALSKLHHENQVAIKQRTRMKAPLRKARRAANCKTWRQPGSLCNICNRQIFTETKKIRHIKGQNSRFKT